MFPVIGEIALDFVGLHTAYDTYFKDVNVFSHALDSKGNKV